MERFRRIANYCLITICCLIFVSCSTGPSDSTIKDLVKKHLLIWDGIYYGQLLNAGIDRSYPLKFDKIDIVKKGELENDGHKQLIRIHVVGDGQTYDKRTGRFDVVLTFELIKNSFGEWECNDVYK